MTASWIWTFICCMGQNLFKLICDLVANSPSVLYYLQLNKFHWDAMSRRQPWSSPFSNPTRKYVRLSKEATGLFVHKPYLTTFLHAFLVLGREALWNSSCNRDLPIVGRLDLQKHSHPCGSIFALDEGRANMDHNSPSNSLLPAIFISIIISLSLFPYTCTSNKKSFLCTLSVQKFELLCA